MYSSAAAALLLAITAAAVSIKANSLNIDSPRGFHYLNNPTTTESSLRDECRKATA
jgi:hypothetical protein